MNDLIRTEHGEVEEKVASKQLNAFKIYFSVIYTRCYILNAFEMMLLLVT